jgi:hypothetical protein
MSIFENSRDEIYELAYYTIPGSNGLPVHKKVNMRVKRDIMGNPTGTEIYGSWRKGGFWTEKDFEAEEPVQELMNRIDNLFYTSVVVDDKKFFESKQKMVTMIENTFKETLIPDHKAKLIQHIPYGADHNAVFAPIDPPRQVM